ncbi:MAG: hypothetical protein RMJ44_11290 [Cytophagales bacterium]|nr:hypothetical protein [Bernardetiaceae bacterium]MDW8211659.1 hypothetical protein [Cytophagales bacterium]
MNKKLSVALLLSLGAIAFCQAQNETPQERAKKKVEPIIKYIDSKITDASKKLTKAQKDKILEARIAYEVSLDSIPLLRDELLKEAEELKAKAAELNQKVAETEEEAAKISQEKEALKARQDALKSKQENLKTIPERLKTSFEETVKKILKGDQLKAYNEMLAAQKTKRNP